MAPADLLDLSPFDLALTVRCWYAGRESAAAAVERAAAPGGIEGALGAILAALIGRA